MNGRKAKKQHRMEEAERERAHEELLRQPLPTPVEPPPDTRIVIVEGEKYDDVIAVPKSTPEGELAEARNEFSRRYGSESIRNMIRMVGKGEDEAQTHVG